MWRVKYIFSDQGITDVVTNDKSLTKPVTDAKKGTVRQKQFLQNPIGL